ncbi:MAG: ROK family protein [Acidobacteriota bacterium]|jgi:glucokinase|nr:ROK family protein [Acidobacteriota bacterium]
MGGENRKQVALGVDIGGTTAKMGYVDHEGNCLASGASVSTGAKQAPAVFFKRLHEAAEALRTGLPPGHEVIGIGVGVANGNYYKATIECSPNLGWDYVDVRAELGKYYAVPVAVTNDANAAALGEMLFGAAKGMRDFISITLGTGLGSGIVAGGKMVYGADGFAGELGHTVVDPDGRECACGRRGCLETYCSATGLCRTVQELICTTTTPSGLRGICYEQLTAAKVSEAALGGDALAKAAFEACGDALGLKLSDAVALLSPEAVIVCGGMAAAGDLILEPTRRALEKHVFPVFRNKVKVLASALPEGNVAILGAGALIWNELDTAR